jgi:hypothetical protein
MIHLEKLREEIIEKLSGITTFIEELDQVEMINFYEPYNDVLSTMESQDFMFQQMIIYQTMQLVENLNGTDTDIMLFINQFTNLYIDSMISTEPAMSFINDIYDLFLAETDEHLQNDPAKNIMRKKLNKAQFDYIY